jgi:hypothetical protein
MIDALIKRVSVTYKCYEMYAHRGKIVQLLVFWDRSRDGRHLFCSVLFCSVLFCSFFTSNIEDQWSLSPNTFIYPYSKLIKLCTQHTSVNQNITIPSPWIKIYKIGLSILLSTIYICLTLKIKCFNYSFT